MDRISCEGGARKSPWRTLQGLILEGRSEQRHAGRTRLEAQMELLWQLLVGAAAGLIAGSIMKGRGFGLLGNIVVGILGGILGGWLFGVIGISIADGTLGVLIQATVGAVVLIFLVGLLKKKAG